MVTALWAYLYGRDGKLLLVCPASDTLHWWDCAAISRVVVLNAPTASH